MNFFSNKNKKDYLSNKINPTIMEGFLNKIDDIICIANFDGTIEIINNPTINSNYKTIKEFFSEEENPALYVKILESLKNKGSYINDLELIKNGKSIKMYVAAYAVSSIKKFFFYIKDTNKYFEKEFELLKEINIQDQYLKSKDLFIANISHEIRTPINIIIGMIYFLKQTNLDNEQLEYLTKLDDASNLLLDMVNGLLDLSNDKSYTTSKSEQSINLKDFLSETIDLLKNNIISKHLEAYIDLNIGNDIIVSVDKIKLAQIFINLIENSIKYTDKGFIEITAQKTEETNLSYKFQFCIKDTGIGIKKEDTLRIFKEYSQVNDPTIKETTGKGIGLAIAKKNIEDLRWENVG